MLKLARDWSVHLNNVSPRKNLGLSPSTVNNIGKRSRESGEISVRKGRGGKPLLNGCDLRTLRRYGVRKRRATVMDISTWVQEYFGKSLAFNMFHHCIEKYDYWLLALFPGSSPGENNHAELLPVIYYMVGKHLHGFLDIQNVMLFNFPMFVHIYDSSGFHYGSDPEFLVATAKYLHLCPHIHLCISPTVLSYTGPKHGPSLPQD